MSEGSMRSGWRPRFFVRGDFDGFVGLFVDNLVQILLVLVLCPVVCGIPLDVVVTRILPALAVSVVIGNAFYSWQAWRLAKATGRDDVTALPYGVNTVSLVAFIFFVMGPVWQRSGDASLALQAGVFACLASGLIELAGAFCVDGLRRWLPRAALLSSLAGIAITFIAMGFVFQIFASPVIALVPMLVLVAAYAGGLRMPGGVPVGLVAIGLGTAVAWATRGLGLDTFTPDTSPLEIGFFMPWPDLGALAAFVAEEGGWQYFSVIFPMALFNLIGSLQSLDSAEAAGDRYETRPSLAANGVGSVVAGLLGSAFPTTIYIGHPGWKAIGARIGYSTVNGVVVCALCFTGTAVAVLRVVPLEATLGILLWIGVVMMAQAYRETPRSHGVAVAMGLVPALAAWGLFLVETALRVAGSSLYEAAPAFGNNLFIYGAIALNQGFLVTGIVLAAVTAFVIDGRFRAAAVACFGAGALALLGVIHGYRLTERGLESVLGLWVAPEFAFCYFLAGALLLGYLRFRPAAQSG